MEALQDFFSKDKQSNSILEALGEGLGFVDEDERFLYLNQAAADTFGLPKEEILGKSLKEFMSEDEFSKILFETTQRKKGIFNTYQIRIIRKDGTPRTILLTASPRIVHGRYSGSYGIFRDITKLNSATEALIQSEKRFRTVSDIISDFAVSFRVDENHSFTAEWFSGALPLRNDGILDDIFDLNFWRKTCFPDDLQKIQDALTQLFEYKESVVFEYRLITKDGSVNWLEIYATPEIDKIKNRVERILVAGRDITVKKAIEEELRLKHYMVEHAAECIFMIRPDASFIYANDSACRTLGYNKEEFQSMHVYDIDPVYEKDRLVEIWEKIKREKVIIRESVQRRKDLSLINTELIINYLVFDNQEYAVSFVKDITERKTDEQIKSIVNGIFNSVNLSTSTHEIYEIIRSELNKTFDTRNLCLLLNDPAQKAFQLYYTRQGVTVTEFTAASDSLEAWIMKTKTPCLLTIHDIRKLEDEGAIKKNGTPAKSWIGAPLHIGDLVIGTISVLSFEHENAFSENHLKILNLLTAHVSMTIYRRQSEEALKISENQLRESNIAKDKFFSIIAHDLRGPFNAIIGFSDLLYSDYDDLEEAEKKTMLRNIHEASLGTFKLLENLLEWSRIQTGRTIPTPENIDISTIANNSLGFLKPQAEKKNIKLFSGIHFGTIAFCDENMITTVIRNLIANAIKFTNTGGSVRIWATLKEEIVEVIVADNGVGISTENISKLFRLDESVKTRGTYGEQGTGLGLLLCKEFIELNNGTIWAESEPGKGSQFKFTLPTLRV